MWYSVVATAEAVSVAVSVISGFVTYQPFSPSGAAGETAIDVVGAVVSTTCTWKVPEPVLPCASVAEQVTVVEPFAKSEPDAGEHVVGRSPSTRSWAVGLENVTVAPAGLVASAATSGACGTAGGVRSETTTWKEPSLEFPLASVAVHWTTDVPTGNDDPESGVQATVGLGSSSSVAVTV